MLAIRMQRTGRTGHAQFRVIVQDSRFSPKSGRVVAYVGNYDPHSKSATIDKEKISAYLTNGAVPSDRVAKLLNQEGVKLPGWYQLAAPKKKSVRNPDKRRNTRPEGAPEPQAKQPTAPTPEESESRTPPEADVGKEAPAAESTEATATEAAAAPAEESETPAPTDESEPQAAAESVKPAPEETSAKTPENPDEAPNVAEKATK
jgi:small subunit ribosomal protein S16